MQTQQVSLQQALQLIVQFLEKNQLEQAENLCRQILEAVPNQPDALHLLAAVAYRTKHYQDALQLMQQAITHNPKLFDAYFHIAIIFEDLEQPQKAIHWYNQGFIQLFNLEEPLSIVTLVVTIFDTPSSHWNNYTKYFTRYGKLQLNVGKLQKEIGRLSTLINTKFDNYQQTENDAYTVIFTLLQFLRFDKNSSKEWNSKLFHSVVLPIMKQALARDMYDIGLSLEGYIYNHYVKQTETEENFKVCFNQWLDEICAAGHKAKVNLPELDKTALYNPVPTIGFFIHNASLLAHIEVLLNMLEGLSQLEEKPFKPIIYAFSGYHEGMLARCQKIGVPVVFVSKEFNERSLYKRLLLLRERIAQDQVAALVWVSLAIVMPFAFSMRVAPVQIWWALKYHELEFDGIDGYISGASSGDYKYFGKKLWRTGALGRTDWYIPELANEASTIRQQYKQFDIILGSLGREEKLDNPDFIQVVAKVLQKYPKAAFLWTGKEQLASIQNIFEQYGVSQQCFFIGWVNTRLYAQVLDIFLDSFPFPCGFTTFETIAAAKPVVLYNSIEANEIGLVSNIAPVLNKLQGTEQDQKRMHDIFYSKGESLYFCAKNIDEYFHYACRFIEEPELRHKSGYANQQFIKYFFASIEKMAISYTKHFLEVIQEKKEQLEHD